MTDPKWTRDGRFAGWQHEAEPEDAEFYSVFGRKPDPYDRKLGLRRVIDLQLMIRSLHS